MEKITEQQYESLKLIIYNMLMSNPEMGLGDIGDCMTAAELAIDEWMEKENIESPYSSYVPEALINAMIDLEQRTSFWKEIRDDFEDDGIRHIDAWTSEDEFDEDGHTIAKIMENGEVEYIDQRAKTDWLAQETIQFWVDEQKRVLYRKMH